MIRYIHQWANSPRCLQNHHLFLLASPLDSCIWGYLLYVLYFCFGLLPFSKAIGPSENNCIRCSNWACVRYSAVFLLCKLHHYISAKEFTNVPCIINKSPIVTVRCHYPHVLFGYHKARCLVVKKTELPCIEKAEEWWYFIKRYTCLFYVAHDHTYPISKK